MGAARFVVARSEQIVLREPGHFLAPALLAALLGFEHEGIALVEVDAADGFAFVAIAPDDALEDVVVKFVGRLRRIRAFEAKHVAQFGEKQRVIGALLPALLALPAGDEAFHRIGKRVGRDRRVHSP